MKKSSNIFEKTKVLRCCLLPIVIASLFPPCFHVLRPYDHSQHSMQISHRRQGLPPLHLDAGDTQRKVCQARCFMSQHEAAISSNVQHGMAQDSLTCPSATACNDYQFQDRFQDSPAPLVQILHPGSHDLPCLQKPWSTASPDWQNLALSKLPAICKEKPTAKSLTNL